VNFEREEVWFLGKMKNQGKQGINSCEWKNYNAVEIRFARKTISQDQGPDMGK